MRKGLPLGVVLAVSAGCGPLHPEAPEGRPAPGLVSTVTPTPPPQAKKPIGPAPFEKGVPSVPMSVAWRYSMRHFQLLPYGAMELSGPVLDGGKLFAGTARGKAIYAINTRTGLSDWSYLAGAGVETTGGVGGGRVYFADEKGYVHALDEATGKLLWRTGIAGVSTSRLLYDGSSGGERLLVPTGDNKLHCLDAVTGSELWVYRREPPADLTIYGTSSPVKVSAPEGMLYVVGFSDGFLVAVRPASGQAAWETKLISAGRIRDVDSTVVQYQDRLYVAAWSDDLFAVDVASGKMLWATAPGGSTGISWASGKIIHSDDQGNVLARDPADGHELWRWAIPAGIPGTPLPAGDLVFVASSASTLYALHADNGTLAWTFDPGYSVSGAWSAPTSGGQRVYFTSNVGTVYALEPSSVRTHYLETWDSGGH